MSGDGSDPLPPYVEEKLPRSFWIKYRLLQIFCAVSPYFVGVACYWSWYINYPFIITHPREDASIVVGIIGYLGWMYAISPNRVNDADD